MGVVDLGKLMDQKALFEKFNIEEKTAKEIFDYLKQKMAGEWKKDVTELTPQGMTMNVGALAFHCYMQGMNDGAQMFETRHQEDRQMAELMARMDPEAKRLTFARPRCPECDKLPLYLVGNLAAFFTLEIQPDGRQLVQETVQLEEGELEMHDEEGVYFLRCCNGHDWESPLA